MTATLPRSRRYGRQAEADTPRRVAIYCRISRDFTGEELGVTRQETLCRDLAARRGWEPVRTFTDNDLSAASGKVRPDYAAMLAEVEAGRVDTIVCVDLDRLLRRPLELEHLIHLAEETGLWAVTVSGQLDLSTEDGRLQARIRTAVSADEVARKGARQHRAAVQAAELGKPPKRRAFGYRAGGMEIDPVEGPAVAEAYRLVLAGASLASIAARWNAAGLRTAFGRASKEWTGGTVRKVILNARYAGIRTYLGEEVGTPGVWPEIVPDKTYRQAVALLRDPARRTSGGATARKHLGGGLYLCGRCGCDMRSSTRGKAGSPLVYHCRASKHLTRVAEPIDLYVTATVRARLAQPDVADLISTESPELAKLQGEGRSLRARIRRLETDYADGEISARILREQTDRLRAELDRIDRRTAELTRTSRLATVAGAADPVAVFDALDVSSQQAVVDALMSVTLLPARPGVKVFDSASVRIEWRQ